MHILLFAFNLSLVRVKAFAPLFGLSVEHSTVRRRQRHQYNYSYTSTNRVNKHILKSQSSENTSIIDERISLAASRRVSSAHISNFKANKCIVLRNIISYESHDERDSRLFSTVAGVVCRLLQCQFCTLWCGANGFIQPEIWQNQSEEESSTIITISLLKPQSKIENMNLLGFDLYADDILIQSVETIESTKGGALKDVYQIYASSGLLAQHGFPGVEYEDRLYGTRGETPTTVVQWSKGTIF